MSNKQKPCVKDPNYICRLREEEDVTFECIYQPGECPWRKKIEAKQEKLLIKKEE